MHVMNKTGHRVVVFSVLFYMKNDKEKYYD